jgi:hypothetical protein
VTAGKEVFIGKKDPDSKTFEIFGRLLVFKADFVRLTTLSTISFFFTVGIGKR